MLPSPHPGGGGLGGGSREMGGTLSLSASDSTFIFHFISHDRDVMSFLYYSSR